MTTSDIEKRR